MDKKSLSSLINELDICYKNFLLCKMHIPTISNKVSKASYTPDFYRKNFDFKIKMIYSPELSNTQIQAQNDATEWLNQCFFLRLYSILDSYQIVKGIKTINSNVKNSKDIEILCKLRQCYSHKYTNFNMSKSQYEKIAKLIEKRYSVEQKYPDRFNIPVDEMIEPMFENCKKYAIDIFEKGLFV